MSTLFAASVLASLCLLAVLLFMVKENRKKRNRMRRLLTHLSELGSLNNLTFSGQEVLKDAAIGLDGVHRKLMILTGSREANFKNRLVRLADVERCSVKKQYRTRWVGGVKRKGQEYHLEKITLHFDVRGGQPVEVAFYDHTTHAVYEIKQMAGKAKHWEAILSKMLRRPFNEAV